MSRRNTAAPPLLNAEQERALGILRDTLVEHEYTAERLGRLLRISVPDDVGLLNRAAALERIRADPSPFATLARLFYLEGPQPSSALARCFGVAARKSLAAADLLRHTGRLRASRLRLDVVDGLYLLADLRLSRPDPVAFGLPTDDVVYPAGSDSALLAGLLPHEEGEVLDLCTGTGIQALAAARVARRVVAVDVGKRAVALARCNARLNGATNVEIRAGDLYKPVRGERFDLILANPPFVAGPRRGPAYHSGGPYGDRVLRRIVRDLPAHSKPGGRALMVSHLALRRGETVADRVRPWFRRGGGHALVLVLEEGSQVDLAAAQSVFALREGLASYEAEIRRWVAYLDHHRVEKIVLILLAYQRRARGRLEVAEAFQRTLPLPLSPPPRQLLQSWFEKGGGAQSSSDSTT